MKVNMSYHGLISGVKQRVGIDIDGVIGDYVQLYLDFLDEVAPTLHVPLGWKPDVWDIHKSLGISKELDDAVFKKLCKPGVANLLQPCGGAVTGVKKLAAIADVYFVSAPEDKSPTWAYDRSRWLIMWFGEELGKKYVSTKCKHTVVLDVFIDDNPANCEKYAEENVNSVVVVWSQPYNRDIDRQPVSTVGPRGIVRTNKWEDVLKIVKLRDENGWSYRGFDW